MLTIDDLEINIKITNSLSIYYKKFKINIIKS